MGGSTSKANCSKCEEELNQTKEHYKVLTKENEQLKKKLPEEASVDCMKAINNNFNDPNFKKYVQDNYDKMFKQYTINIGALNITYKFVSSCNTFKDLNERINNRHQLNYDECIFIRNFIVLLTTSYKQTQKQKYLKYKQKYLKLKK